MFLREMEVVTVELVELRVLQRERVAPRRDGDIVAGLRGMGENARKTVEHALAELDRVVTGSTSREILDDVVAEVRGKHEGIRPSLADHDVVAGGAGQRVAAARA